MKRCIAFLALLALLLSLAACSQTSSPNEEKTTIHAPTTTNTPTSEPGTATTAPAELVEMPDIAPITEMEAVIYAPSIRGDGLVRYTETIDANPEGIVAALIARHAIPDNLRVQSFRIETNGTETVDGEIATYTVGDQMTLLLDLQGDAPEKLQMMALVNTFLTYYNSNPNVTATMQLRVNDECIYESGLCETMISDARELTLYLADGDVFRVKTCQLESSPDALVQALVEERILPVGSAVSSCVMDDQVLLDLNSVVYEAVTNADQDTAKRMLNSIVNTTLSFAYGAAAPGTSMTLLLDGKAPVVEGDMVYGPTFTWVDLPLLRTSGFAENYDAVYTALRVHSYSGGLPTWSDGLELPVEEAAEAPRLPMMDAVVEEADEAPSMGEDYSGTNVQVQGIDEADSVKTDGRYIYILRDQTVSILRADGADTVPVAEILPLDTAEESSIAGLVPDAEDVSYGIWMQEMYLYQDQLILIGSSYVSYRTGEKPRYERRDETAVVFYDISNPEAPRYLCRYRQSGSYWDSRLSGGQLVLVSNQWVYSCEQDDLYSYIPCIDDGAGYALLEPTQIWLPEDGRNNGFVVVSSVDLFSHQELASMAVLGCCDTMYMTAGHLYLAWTEYKSSTGQPWKELIYTVTEVTEGSVTHLLHFDLSDGIVLAGQTQLDGYLDSQFSLDAYEGNLRLVLTEKSSMYRIYRDEERGFTNYDWPEDAQRSSNLLLVLDSELNEIGRVDRLGENERVYSARFDGDYAYFVTFRQTDPLFCVDLTDPTAPQVRSELHLPGFSDYLHPWSAGRLFGLGKSADADGRIGGMKLAMYDTENPEDLRELHTLVLDDWSSTALYNHKAILISHERNLIGFPVDNGYLLYSYDDAAGFTELARVDLDWFDWDSRGLYIGGSFYICGSSHVTVLDLEDFAVLTVLELRETDQGFNFRKEA